MTHWPQDALEAVYTLARGLHDERPHDRAVGDLMTMCEYELHSRRDDPAQLRARLDLRGDHENALNGSH